MKTNKHFNLFRLYNLLRRDLTMNSKSLFIGFGAVAGLLLLLLIGDSYARGYINYQPFIATFYFFFYIGGFLFTSRIFNELHQPEKSYQYLTLPASSLEKLISQWLISAVGYAVAAFIGLVITAFLGGVISSVLFDMDFQMLNLTNTRFIANAKEYLVIQSIFFLGACAFRNYNFIKTLLAMFIVSFVIGLFTAALGYFLLGQTFMSEMELMSHIDSYAPAFITENLIPFLNAIYWYGLAPFLLVVSYFKLKERQI